MSAAPDGAAASLLSGANLEALAALCRRFHVRTLDVFGSAATGRFDPARSDLDFLVEFDKTPGGPWFAFESELEALFGRPVDVLSEPLNNPFLRRSVEATRRRLFPRPERSDARPIDPAMSEKKPAKYLWDAVEAAARVERFTRGRSFDDYSSDEMLRDAVERRLQVIGEAFVGLRRVDPVLAARIPDLPKIIAFRNIVVHMYSDIHHDKVWEVIERDLPNLRAILERLLAEAAGP